MLSLSSELSPNTEQFIQTFAKFVTFVCGLEFPVLLLLMLSGVRGANVCVLNAQFIRYKIPTMVPKLPTYIQPHAGSNQFITVDMYERIAMDLYPLVGPRCGSIYASYKSQRCYEGKTKVQNIECCAMRSKLQLPRLELDLPVATSKLHSDILPEVNVLTRHLDDIEAAEDVGGHHSHLSPGKAEHKASVSASALCNI